LQKQTASIREFARIIGVDHAAVSRAVTGGDRLRNSVVDEDGRKKIIIFDGCLEWHHNKQHRKDNRKDQPRTTAGTQTSGIMPREVSSDLDSHYSALIKQVEHGRLTGQLMPAARFQQEAAECFRACRDTLLNLPLTVSEIAKGIMVRLVREQGGDESVQTMDQPLNDAALKIRVEAKSEVRKALIQASKILQDGGREQVKEAMDTDDQGL
jgi:hypothetical protein